MHYFCIFFKFYWGGAQLFFPCPNRYFFTALFKTFGFATVFDGCILLYLYVKLSAFSYISLLSIYTYFLSIMCCVTLPYKVYLVWCIFDSIDVSHKGDP